MIGTSFVLLPRRWRFDRNVVRFAVSPLQYTWESTDSKPLPFDTSYAPKLAVGAMLSALGARGVAREYAPLADLCANSTAASGAVAVASSAACQQLCDAQVRGSRCR